MASWQNKRIKAINRKSNREDLSDLLRILRLRNKRDI